MQWIIELPDVPTSWLAALRQAVAARQGRWGSWMTSMKEKRGRTSGGAAAGAASTGAGVAGGEAPRHPLGAGAEPGETFSPKRATAGEAMRECDALWQRTQAALESRLMDLCGAASGEHDMKELGAVIVNLKRIQDGRRQALLLTGAADAAVAADGALEKEIAAAIERLDALGDDDDDDSVDGGE